MNYSQVNVRQLDILPEEFIKIPILIIGVGGIGSTTCYILSKMGFKNITIADPDKVELHNISTQMYSLEDEGKYKVLALKEKIKKELDIDVKFINKKVSGIKNEFEDYEIIIFALDTMDERIKIWKNIKKYNNATFLIDARMGLEMIRLYNFNTCDMNGIREYEKTLYSSKEAINLPCTGRAVAYNTFFIGSLISLQIRKILTEGDGDFELLLDLGKTDIYKYQFPIIKKREKKGK